MGLGGSGDLAGDVNFTANSNAVGLGAFGADASSTQFGTTGTTATTTTVQKFTTTSSSLLIGTTNILQPIINTSVNEPIVAGSTEPTA